jgi:uncharacterized Tic20 family protein
MPAKKKVDPQVKPPKIVQSVPKPEPLLTPAAVGTDIASQALAPGDEHTWGMAAHLSTYINLLTGFGGPIAALIIYMVYKDRSRFVAYHAMQAMVFQLIWWFGGGALIGLMWAIVGILSAFLVGIVLIPVAIVLTPILALLPMGALVYGTVAAVKVSQGQDFKYWLVGDWVRGTLTGI